LCYFRGQRWWTRRTWFWGRLNQCRPDGRIGRRIRVNVRRSRGLHKYSNNPHQGDHNGQKQTKPTPPMEACPATFSIRRDGCADLFGAQVVHQA